MSGAAPTSKPQCGGGGVGDAEYDAPLHIAAIFLVFTASIFGAGFPVVARKFPKLKIPPKVFFFTKHFGTGVLVATAFVHLLPTAFDSLNDPCLPDLFTTTYRPIPGVIAMAALFTLFTIEMWLNHKMGGHSHSHGGPTGAEFSGGPIAQRSVVSAPKLTSDVDSDYSLDLKEGRFVEQFSLSPPQIDRESEMPPWFIAFYRQYVRQMESISSTLNRYVPQLPEYKAEPTTQVTEMAGDEEQGRVDPLVYKKMSLDITLLEGGILFHSVFVGMTVSITTDGFIVLLIAILFHQTFEGLGLGSRIAAVPYPKGSIKPWVLVVAFGTTAPFGQLLGVVTRGSYDPNSAFALILVGTFNAISSGLLIYAATVDLLSQDFLSEDARQTLTIKDKIIGFIYVLMGAMGMGIVGAFA
ncbi:MAG: hypothetical protein M1820_004870 [Bogoriella megaspora]|nr:MAG: hypothetical protein M1820_004870 [Bogoriella megaspora]